MNKITVTVAAAWPDRATEVEVELSAGATVAQALAAALGVECPPGAVVGVYGVRVPRDTVLADGDRIEIYRQLEASPRDARRRRAKRTSTD